MATLKIQRGFTLIELLVVVSIIGILSTLAVFALNDARAKARDAKRLSDVKQIVNILAMEATQQINGVQDLTGCDAAIAEKNVRSCTGPGTVSKIVIFSDPRVSDPDLDSNICTADSDSICQYSMAVGSTNVQNAKVIFYLESSGAQLDAGLRTINIDGIIN